MKSDPSARRTAAEGMADDVCVSKDLNARNGVYRYVRRVPEDLPGAFPLRRILKSLG